MQCLKLHPTTPPHFPHKGLLTGDIGFNSSTLLFDELQQLQGTVRSVQDTGFSEQQMQYLHGREQAGRYKECSCGS